MLNGSSLLVCPTCAPEGPFPWRQVGRLINRFVSLLYLDLP